MLYFFFFHFYRRTGLFCFFSCFYLPLVQPPSMCLYSDPGTNVLDLSRFPERLPILFSPLIFFLVFGRRSGRQTFARVPVLFRLLFPFETEFVTSIVPRGVLPHLSPRCRLSS